MIPELAEIMEIQRCSLFHVRRDQAQIVLEAGYPGLVHGIGITRSIEEPYVDAIVNQRGPFGDFMHEKVYSHYVLINNPKESSLLSPDMKHFLETQQIHSVLYIPLKSGETVNYFLAFDAQAQHAQFTDEEIEVLTFLGMELMKGLRLEKMEDLLHDFKSPAIALAGFVKRVREILGGQDYPRNEKLDQALNILLKESTRLQDLSLTLQGEGREMIVDLTEVLKGRFLINEEALRELKRDRIRLVQQELASPLKIRCFPIYLERVIDNLLSNASNAIPEEGGELSVRTYRSGLWAVAEIANTGQITEEERERYLLGEGRGRGLHICTQLVKQMGGVIGMEAQGGLIIFRLMIPMAEP